LNCADPSPGRTIETRTAIYSATANAARTMAALREMGYDSVSAIMDLIDNSLDAGAKNVDVTVKDRQVAIDIADDGVGMDAKTLAEALRLGVDIEHNAGRTWASSAWG
jgi:sensor histidine kinase regulating citrate/malate metabolism